MAENIGMSYALQSELMYMRDVIGLVAFAVEARRVLGTVDAVAEVIPHVGETLSGAIEMRGQWTVLPDTAARVLEELHERLDRILREGGEA